MKFAFKSFVLLLTVLITSPANACEEVRGAFDIGSGSTKAYVAKVDSCKKIIVETLMTEQVSIGFKDSLEKSSDQTFDAQVTEEARAKFQALVKKMKDLKATKISAVATAAFRKATNSGDTIKKIAGDTGVAIRVISQSEEARLGVRSAMVAVGPEAKFIGVWDIGGGSMQMTYIDTEGKTQLYEGDLASVNFKNQVIEDILKKDPKVIFSPNPLNLNFSKATLLARKHAQKNAPTSLKKSAPKTQWLGIGGVWWFSVRTQLNKAEIITEAELHRILKLRSTFSDAQIGGDYASTDVTNLALVLGYMRALDIKEVKPIEASLVQGLVLE